MSARESKEDPAKKRGVVRRVPGELPFEFAVYEPAEDLRDLVACFWRTSWTMASGESHDQEILASAHIGMVVDTGEGGRSGVWGPTTGMFVRRLSGAGRAFGIKFSPGAFRALCPRPASDFTDRCVPLEEVFGDEGGSLDQDIRHADDATSVERAQHFLRDQRGELCESSRLAAQAMGLIETTHILEASMLASEMAMSERSLQRLFKETLGVTPKWAIRRLRFQEALERLHRGEAVDLAALAHELGYYDQAHFNREFKAIMGCAPRAYTKGIEEDA